MVRQYNFPLSQLGNCERPPDWRWQRACELVAQETYASTKRDDELTCRAARYLRLVRRLCTEAGYRQLAIQEPDLFLAFKLAQEDGLRPLEIRARVLARETDEAIARKVGLTVPAVAAYVGLHYGVRDKLEARSFVVHTVIGMPPVDPPSDEQLMLLSAYHHGPHVVDPWLDFLPHAGEQHDLRTGVGRTRASIEQLRKAHNIPQSNTSQKALIRQLGQFVRSSAKNAKSRSAGAVVSQNVAQQLSCFGWQNPQASQIDTSATSKAVRKRAPQVTKQQTKKTG